MRAYFICILALAATQKAAADRMLQAVTNDCETLKPCHATATCTNTLISYVCKCETGYVGDGVAACTDIDECTIVGICSNPNAHCLNSPGSFGCRCNPGYTGNGDICNVAKPSPTNGCLTGKHSCDANATCNAEDGYTYRCDCNAGYASESDGSCTAIPSTTTVAPATTASTTQSLDPTGECARLTPCHANATCTDTPSGHTCACNTGYTGNGVTCTAIPSTTTSTRTIALAEIAAASGSIRGCGALAVLTAAVLVA